MSERSIRDVVIVLPGIMGSVLEKDGKEIWGFTGEALMQYILSAGNSLQELKVKGFDDGSIETLEDGIKSTRLMPDVHLVPGLWKIDGYGQLCRVLREAFDLTLNENYFEFHYDWRRDNRVASRRLNNLITRVLPAWREKSGNSSAQVILIGHSMGGLISRYYLEVLEGWKVCKALITFGTPFRGSVKAMNYLLHGYRAGLTDLTQLFCSCPSVYQLLPTYKAIQLENNENIYIAQYEGLSDTEREKALMARAFHCEIDTAVATNSKDDLYRRTMRLFPVIGNDQPTLQSAVVKDHTLTASTAVPFGVDTSMSGGDGTVPLPSAIPLELSSEFRFPFFAELHASLQNNPFALKQLVQWIRQSQTVGLENLKALIERETNSTEDRPSLSLRVEDLCRHGEPTVISARVLSPQGGAPALMATLYPLYLGQEPQIVQFEAVEDNWLATFHNLPIGTYRIRVSSHCAVIQARPTPVSDVFVVSP
jgi:pimeloyl-ACP methyl ester carboxylesterase